MRLGPLRKSFTSLHELTRKLASIMDYSLWLLFDLSKFIRIKTEEIDKILVVLINQEKGNVGGDFCTMGVLNYFKEAYPNIKLSLLADKKTLDQFGNVLGIEFIEYKEKEILEQVKSENFQAVIFMNFGPLKVRDFSFILYRIGKTPTSIGSFLRSKNRIFFTRKIYVSWGLHMVDIRYKMLEALGLKFKIKKLKFYYDKKDKLKVEAYLKKSNIKKFIIFHPGGKYVAESYKAGKWPPHLWNLDRYAKVADYFIEKGYKIIITGNKEEEILFREIIKKSKDKKQIINACGKLSIKEAGALLKKSKLLIATDTSIVHIAYQVGVPIVELMGPSIPEVVGAWPLNSPKHKILVDKGPCSRSMRKLPFKDNFNCLKNIKIKDVIEAGEKLLKKFAKN